MVIERHPSSEGTRVWLSSEELLAITDVHPVGSKEWTAVNLFARSGLKVKELGSLKRGNVSVEGPQASLQLAGSGRHRTLRECPIPESVAYTILAFDEGEIFDVALRTIRRWVKRAARQLADETGKEDWKKVSPADLRRSWVDVLLSDDVPPEVIRKWGGWTDSEMFHELYLSRRHNTTTSLSEAKRSDIYEP